MAGLTLLDIFKRLKKLQNGEMKCISSLIYTLRTYLTQIIQEPQELDTILSKTVCHEEFIPNENFNEEEVDQQTMVKFGEIIIEVLAKYSPTELSHMILQLPVFLDYISIRMYNVINGFPSKSCEDYLCLVFYLMKRNDIEKARLMFDQINHSNLRDTLQKHYKILFESMINSKNVRVVNFTDFADIFFLSGANNQHQRLFTDICLYVLTETQYLDFDTLLKMFMDYLSALIGGKSYINGQNLVQDFLEKYFINRNVKRCVNSTKTGDDYTMDIFSSNSEPGSLTSISFPQTESESSLKRSIKILTRLYLTHLKYATNTVSVSNASNTELKVTEDENSEEQLKLLDNKIDKFISRHKSFTKHSEIQNTSNILFHERRYTYLSYMSPFEENLLIDDSQEFEMRKIDADTYQNLLKLQSILCNQDLAGELHKDVVQFLQANSDLIGSDSILSCIYPVNVGVEFMLEKSPQAILQYAIDRFKTDDDWICLVKSIQNKVNLYDEACDLKRLLLYYRIFRGTINYF